MSCALGKWNNYHEIDAQVGDGDDRWNRLLSAFLCSERAEEQNKFEQICFRDGPALLGVLIRTGRCIARRFSALSSKVGCECTGITFEGVQIWR